MHSPMLGSTHRARHLSEHPSRLTGPGALVRAARRSDGPVRPGRRSASPRTAGRASPPRPDGPRSERRRRPPAAPARRGRSRRRMPARAPRPAPGSAGTTIGVPKRSASMHSRAMYGPGARSMQRLAWASRRHRSIRVSTETLPRSARPFHADATASSTTTTSASLKAALSQAAAGGGSRWPPAAVAEHQQVVREAESMVPVSLGEPVHRDVDAHRVHRHPPAGGGATPVGASRPRPRGTGPPPARPGRGASRRRASVRPR